MKTDWIQARQTKYTGYITIYILVIVAILGVANFLANRYNKSYDATSNKEYSLSDQTEKAVKGLKNDVNVTYFGETGQFPQARDLLGRYANLSPKLKVDYVDPVKNPQKARAAGIRQEGTIVVDTGARKEDAKSLTEEEITGALVRALKGGERNVCFLTGGGEHSIDNSEAGGLEELKKALERNNYKTRSISLAQLAGSPAAGQVIGQAPQAKMEIPKDCTVVVVGGPKASYPPSEVNAIKAYVEGGGRALMMLDTPLRLGKEETAENTDMVKLLGEWGVTLNNDLALDTSGLGSAFGLGPEIPIITNYEPQPIVRDLKAVTAFPISRTMKVAGTAKVTVDKLIATSDNSFATTSVQGNLDQLAKKGAKGPLVIAATGTYNTGNPSNPGRFVVFGSSMWADNYYIRSGENRDLALNTFNWLTSDEDLISIRPKEPQDRRLNMGPNRISLVFWWSVVILPVGVVACGMMVWWRRR